MTKPLASVDEMVNSGMMVIMNKKGGIAKRVDLEIERTIRDLAKRAGGSEVIVESWRFIHHRNRCEIQRKGPVGEPQENNEGEQSEGGHQPG